MKALSVTGQAAGRQLLRPLVVDVLESPNKKGQCKNLMDAACEKAEVAALDARESRQPAKALAGRRKIQSRQCNVSAPHHSTSHQLSTGDTFDEHP